MNRHAIADHMGIPRKQFSDWLRTADPDLLKQLPVVRGGWTSHVARERIDEIRWMADGETLRPLARELGIQPASLARRLSRHGETALLNQLRRRQERTAA